MYDDILVLYLFRGVHIFVKDPTRLNERLYEDQMKQLILLDHKMIPFVLMASRRLKHRRCR